MTTRTEGTTAEGVHVLVIHGERHYADDEVFIDGKAMTVEHVRRLRDGGTTTYVTEAGTLTLPHRIGSTDRTPRWFAA